MCLRHRGQPGARHPRASATGSKGSWRRSRCPASGTSSKSRCRPTRPARSTSLRWPGGPPRWWGWRPPTGSTPMLSDKVVGGIMSSARVAEAPGFRHITRVSHFLRNQRGGRTGRRTGPARVSESGYLLRPLDAWAHPGPGSDRVTSRRAASRTVRRRGAHSPIPVVEEASRELERLGADSVIAIGGGSAIVTARAASILHAEKRDVRELCTQRGPPP